VKKKELNGNTRVVDAKGDAVADAGLETQGQSVRIGRRQEVLRFDNPLQVSIPGHR
jgi:hypothetical protein